MNKQQRIDWTSIYFSNAFIGVAEVWYVEKPQWEAFIERNIGKLAVADPSLSTRQGVLPPMFADHTVCVFCPEVIVDSTLHASDDEFFRTLDAWKLRNLLYIGHRDDTDSWSEREQMVRVEMQERAPEMAAAIEAVV